MIRRFSPFLERAFDGTLTEDRRDKMLTYIRNSGAIEKAQQ